MVIISPSVLAADFSRLGEEVNKVYRAGAKYIHLDVMDGAFVPNISFGMPVIASLRKATEAFFDVHLMIEEPIRYVDDFKKAGAELLTVHYESCNDFPATLRAIRESGMKVSASVKPATPVEVLFPYLEELDMVLIMTVEPGFGGQKLIPETVEKVRILRREALARGLDLDIQVDGGITAENLHTVTEAGANVIVAGSAVFRAEDPAATIENMLQTALDHPFVG